MKNALVWSLTYFLITSVSSLHNPVKITKVFFFTADEQFPDLENVEAKQDKNVIKIPDCLDAAFSGGLKNLNKSLKIEVKTDGNSDITFEQLSYGKYIDEYRQQISNLGKVIIKPGSTQEDTMKVLSNPEVMTYRQQVFSQNSKQILNFNKGRNKKFEMGYTIFTILTQQQFEQFYLSKNLVLTEIPKIQPLKSPIFSNLKRKQEQKQETSLDIKSNFSQPRFLQKVKLNNDWRCSKLFLIKARNQDGCGSCYIFSALDVLSFKMMLDNVIQEFTELSAQQLLDCKQNNNVNLDGCNGGNFAGVYEYMKKNGVVSESIYNYKGTSTPENKCQTNGMAISKAKRRKVLEYDMVKKDDIADLKEKLKIGPLAIVISITKQFSHFKRGTYLVSGNNRQYMHGVVLIGFHSSYGYLIRNSWGLSWGTNGYAFIQTENIARYAVYVKKYE